jgi:integrase
MASFDTTPQTTRRAMTPEEIATLLNACPQHRRLVYEVAFLTGLRVNELRSLTIDHLDVENNGLRLDAEWTKNRNRGFQPLPATLTSRLRAYAQSGAAIRQYSTAYGNKTPNAPTRPLLHVLAHPARAMDRDLEAGGIE